MLLLLEGRKWEEKVVDTLRRIGCGCVPETQVFLKVLPLEQYPDCFRGYVTSRGRDQEDREISFSITITTWSHRSLEVCRRLLTERNGQSLDLERT